MDNVMRLLIIETSEAEARALVDQLQHIRPKIEFERAANDADLKNALKKSWDLVICNTRLPELKALDALKIVRENRRSLPFIFVSPTQDEDEAVSAIHAGASDYVSKGNMKRLVLAVERALNEAKIHSEHRVLQSQKMDSLEQLTNGIAHDFNNLLMVIQCNLDILRIDLVGDEEHTQQIDQALDAVHAGADLIRKLITFSQMQHQQTESTNAPSTIERKPRRTISGLRGEESILIVDDEESLRQLTGRYLESLGYHVLQAEDSTVAMQVLQADPAITLLLTDIMMPGELSAAELVDWAVAKNPNLKVIYMSGYSQEVLESKYSINREKYPVLLKPFSRLDLAILLRNILNMQS